MKKVVVVISLFVVSFAFANSEVKGKYERAVVKVNGMVCSFCAQGIEKKFKNHKHVEKLKVDLEGEKVTFWFKKNEGISDNELKKTLKDSGYDVVEINRKKVDQL